MTGVQSGSLSGVQYGTPRAYTPCAGVPKQGKDALFICLTMDTILERLYLSQLRDHGEETARSKVQDHDSR